MWTVLSRSSVSLLVYFLLSYQVALREEWFCLWLQLCICLFLLLVLAVFPSDVFKLFCYVYIHLGCLSHWLTDLLLCYCSMLLPRGRRFFSFAFSPAPVGLHLGPGFAALLPTSWGLSSLEEKHLDEGLCIYPSSAERSFQYPTLFLNFLPSIHLESMEESFRIYVYKLPACL